MPVTVVDIAEFRVCADREATLVTYALGSCIAVALCDPSRGVAGMIHFMLPLSTTSAERARERPAMFCDTGVPMLFEAMYALGCKKSDLLVYVVGGAQVQDSAGVFNIGKRNYAVLRKMFWKNNIMINAEHVGGDRSRTLTIEVASGRVRLRMGGEESILAQGVSEGSGVLGQSATRGAP